MAFLILSKNVCVCDTAEANYYNRASLSFAIWKMGIVPTSYIFVIWINVITWNPTSTVCVSVVIAVVYVVVGWIMNPQTLNLNPVNVTLHGKGLFPDVIKLKVSRWGGVFFFLTYY